jgi:hypothetical protein
VIERCWAHDNKGIPEKKENHSGNGIVIGCVDGARIDACEADGNGADCNAPVGGPVGIWCWECRGVVIERCESHHNRTGAASLDGGGFDLDGGAVDSEIRFCFSHDNDGAGYLLCQYAGARPFHGCRVHHNVSVGDGRAHGYGAITTYGGAVGDITGCIVHHNTLIVGPAAAGQPAVVHVIGQPQEVLFAANSIIGRACDFVKIDAPVGGATRFIGNVYDGDDKRHAVTASGFLLGEHRIATIEAWRQAGFECEGGAIRGGMASQVGSTSYDETPAPPHLDTGHAAVWGALENEVDIYGRHSVPLPRELAWTAPADVATPVGSSWARGRIAGAVSGWPQMHGRRGEPEEGYPPPAVEPSPSETADVALYFDDWEGMTIMRPGGFPEAPLRFAAVDRALSALSKKDLVFVRVAGHVGTAWETWQQWEDFRLRMAKWLRGCGFTRMVIFGGNTYVDRVLATTWSATWSPPAATPPDRP